MRRYALDIARQINAAALALALRLDDEDRRELTSLIVSLLAAPLLLRLYLRFPFLKLRIIGASHVILYSAVQIGGALVMEGHLFRFELVGALD